MLNDNDRFAIRCCIYDFIEYPDRQLSKIFTFILKHNGVTIKQFE